MTIIDGDTLKEAYKNAANIDDREKENAYKMIDQQIEAQKEKLEAEGHTIIQKGRTNIKYFVKDYESVLFDLR